MTGLWLMLLGFRPLGGTIPVGPPVPSLDIDSAQQWRLSARPRWQAFKAQWPGRWAVRWDPARATPRFLWTPGVPIEQAESLVADVARLAGVDPAELEGPRLQRTGGRQILHWDRTYRGAEVVGDRVALVVQGESIGGVWAQLTVVPGRLEPQAGEIIIALPPRAAPALAVRSKEGSEQVYRDRQGQELHRYETRYAARVELTVEERTVGDALISAPARDVRLRGPEGHAVTDEDGAWSGVSPEDLIFRGEQLEIRDNRDPVVVPALDPLPDPWVIRADEDVPYAANTVLHNVPVAWDWLGDLWPTHPWLTDRIEATVRSDMDVCNAWYDGSSIAFMQADPARCNDFGRIADVVFHELGHGIHHRILATGTFASDVSEGSADYISATINDDARVGINAYPDGSEVRDIEPDRRYPDHFVGEVHNDGLIWASMIWNLRQDWALESSEGVRSADMLFLRTLEQGPALLDLYEAVLLADDEDGDLSTGTPHDCELMSRMEAHGIGPGPIGVIDFEHTPLEGQASAAEAYEITFSLTEVTPDCGDLDRDSVRVWYTSEAPATPGVSEESGDTGSPGLDDSGSADFEEDLYLGWSSVRPDRDGSIYTAWIPRYPANTELRYFIEASSTDGTQLVQTHGGRADRVWRFWVGDRRALWCDGFETLGDGWEHGPGMPGVGDVETEWHSEWSFSTPLGSTWGPDSAYEGGLIAVTAVDQDYGNNNLQFLSSPVLDLSEGGPMLMLSTRRWLTVEDSIYDVARVWAGSTELWRNPGSPGGQEHTLDDAWVQHNILLDDRLDDLGEVQFHWTLQTDPGLEFGGWALDDVCVVALDDVEGHYRVKDLSASVDLPEIHLAWTQPWVQPLLGTVLVRRAGGPPLNPLDGDEIERDDAPRPGEARTLIDWDVEVGVDYHYALFVTGPRADDVSEGGVLGEDLAIGRAELAEDSGLPTDTGADDNPVDTGTMGSPGDDSGAAPASDSAEPGGSVSGAPEGPKTGCGCSAPGAQGGNGRSLFWLSVLAVLLRRRTQRSAPEL